MQKKKSIVVEKVNEHIVNWLKDYAVNAGVNGFVVGISGGIDSAVTSSFCAQTGLKVVCVEMPIHQHESQVSRGREHIDQLMTRFPNVSEAKADLTQVFDDFKKDMPIDTTEDKLYLTLANTRSRLRMITLYYYAGIYGLLVAGTGNKIEDFGVGFYTKYGDGGVDVNPIADLMKSEVYSLGKYLSVPESILTAAPTDGLFGDDRCDEDQLGATYDELEWAMNVLDEESEILTFTERQKEVLKIYKRLHRINQHKMNPIPVCLIPSDLKV